MVKSFGSSNAAGLSDLKSRLARRGSVSHRAAAAARAVPKEAGRLCRGAIAERNWGAFPTYQLDRHVGVNDRYTPS